MQARQVCIFTDAQAAIKHEPGPGQTYALFDRAAQAGTHRRN